MKTQIMLATLIMLTGCAGEYTFNSNLDADKIDDYFKAGDVQVFDNHTVPLTAFDNLGLVEGEVCQEGLNDAPAAISEARTLARREAANLGGNGIIIKKCLVFSEKTQHCFSRALCVGQAIKSHTKDEPASN